MIRPTISLLLALGAFACATAPPPAPVVKPIAPTFEQKMTWILRLEDQRSLRDPAPPPPPPPAPAPPVRGKTPIVASPPPPPPPPDLVRLLADDEARVRRRAALAVGRVGLKDGIEPLVKLLGDADPEVRQMAAFALGLIGDGRARDPLVRTLADPSPLVQSSAVEALGLIGDGAAAESIGKLLAQLVESGVLASPPGEEAETRRDTPAATFRLGLVALARLKAFEPLAAAVLDGGGQPRVRWWPVAFALQRIEDARALNALLTLAGDPTPYTRALAIKGLAALKNRTAMPILLTALSSGDRAVVVEAIRAVGRIGDIAGAAPLLKIVQDRRADPHARLEAVAALGNIHAPGVNDILLDLFSDSNPDVRSAAMQSSAALEPEQFVAVLSALDSDPDWRVRAALATVLGTLPPDVARPRLTAMLNDSDQRVVPAVLAALIRARAPNVASLLVSRLTADDPVVRAAAANGVGEIKPADGARALAAAYELGLRDATYVARAAALVALSKYGAAEAQPVLQAALADKDWAVRVRAAKLLEQFDPSRDAATEIRPAPTQLAPDAYRLPRLGNPPVSTQVFLETDRGTIQIELAVLDAPLAVENFVTLARRGFFDGLSVHRVVPDFVVQTGDPRGDGEGGPSYTIRDELNQRPYLRGTVGMALDWPDTAGSQFFITYSPQPHLDAKYTVFGRVIDGMEVVDNIQRGDVIRHVRVWDGQQ